MKTYKEQFNRLTEAYIKNEIDPFNDCACFVGNLLGTDEWGRNRMYKRVVDKRYPIRACVCPTGTWEGEYSTRDIIKIERSFLTTYIEHNSGRGSYLYSTIDFELHKAEGCIPANETFESVVKLQEEALFKAFEAALDTLKEVHKEMGEDVEEEFEFKKRVLKPEIV